MRFSVIIPIYNVEPYLRECVDSVLAQTCQDFEAILVNDGSTDGCPAICDAYAAQDERIRVIHKPNGGLVSARQAGAELAQGDYVVCVDSDDYIMPTMLERTAALIDEGNADVVAFGVRYFTDDASHDVHEPIGEGWYDRAKLESALFPHILMDENMKYIFHFLCGKAIRRSLYTPHQMAVDRRISVGEDVACLMPVYMDAQKAYISHESMYCVRQRVTSISRRFSLKQFDQLIVGIGDLRKLGNDPIRDFQAQVDRYTLMSVFVQLMNAVEYNGGDQLDALCECVHHPVIWQGVQQAVFAKVTPKSRITYALLRRDRIKETYHFLRLCEWIKKAVKKG